MAQPDVAAHIVSKTTLMNALQSQGLFVGKGGEYVSDALSQWLRGAGYPASFQQVSIDEYALTAAAVPAGEILEHLAAQTPGTYGGAARLWPSVGVPAPAPGSGARPTSMLGRVRLGTLGPLSAPTTTTVLVVGGVALLVGGALGALGMHLSMKR